MNRSTQPLLILAAAAAAMFASSGCISKSQAAAQARIAYLAGQRDALIQAQQMRSHGNTVTLIGPVSHPIIDWTDGLTLARAIVDAVYNSPANPTQILIRRSGQVIAVDPKQLLGGQDFPLESGDIVEFH